jgi:uncharacterized damage-inducible protein DinB
MTDHILLLLTRELETCAAEVEAFPDDEIIWALPEGISNSAGNLAMHVAGNLRHFIGRELGGTDYVRDRAAEFGTRSGSREALARELRATADELRDVLPRLPAEVLELPYPVAFGDVRLPTARFLLHLCSHAAFHLGQIGYLRRILTGENRSVGVVQMSALAG